MLVLKREGERERVCVRERERERAGFELNFAIAGNIGIGCYSCRAGGREGGRESESVCVCV